MNIHITKYDMHDGSTIVKIDVEGDLTISRVKGGEMNTDKQASVESVSAEELADVRMVDVKEMCEYTCE